MDSLYSVFIAYFAADQTSSPLIFVFMSSEGVAVISAENHKRQRRKRQFVTAKREKLQTPKVLTAILSLPNLT